MCSRLQCLQQSWKLLMLQLRTMVRSFWWLHSVKTSISRHSSLLSLSVSAPEFCHLTNSKQSSTEKRMPLSRQRSPTGFPSYAMHSPWLGTQDVSLRDACMQLRPPCLALQTDQKTEINMAMAHLSLLLRLEEKYSCYWIQLKLREL